MRILVIECATEACSVALFEGSELIAGSFEVLGRGHAERLVPMISELPDKGRAARIAVSRGPGSFTGVRVGLAAARALAFAWQAELCGYTTLDLVAAIAQKQRSGQPVLVAMTGGHGEWFVQSFSAQGKALGAHQSLASDQACAIDIHVVAGSQAATLVDQRGWGEVLAILPDARAFGLLAKDQVTRSADAVYGRPPDAKLP